MSVLSHPEYDQHEEVAFCHDRATGLKAIISVHSTRLGHALGGCRMWPYPSDAHALTDALRLSRGMTYKAALAGLPQGGGKSVIIGDPRVHKTPELLRAMGRFVDSFGGDYVVAEDSGTTVSDMQVISQATTHVAGLATPSSASTGRTGDPSPSTAKGVFIGIKAAVRARLGRDDLEDVRVGIQGLGNVGSALAGLLADAGAKLWVTDLGAGTVNTAIKKFSAQAVPMEAIYSLDVDVFAPCALGAVLNDATIPRLKAPIVAGAANNQLARAEHDWMLFERGILYAPDYVINAGGVIDVYHEKQGYDGAKLERHLERIGTTLDDIFTRSLKESRPTGAIADEAARMLGC